MGREQEQAGGVEVRLGLYGSGVCVSAIMRCAYREGVRKRHKVDED